MPTRTTALDSPEAEVSTIRRELYHAVPGALARTLLVTYAMLAAAFALALGTGSALGYAVGFALVVAVQTRLAMFMHEGAHWLVDADKTVNDRLANWLAAFPIGMTVERYRASHLQHHARLGTADDPDFTALCLPPVEQGVGASVLACLTGWRHVKLVQKYLGERDAEAGPSRAPSSASSVIGRIGSQGLLFGIGVLAGQWWAYFVLWLLPLATFGVLINEVRSVVEYTPLLPRGADGASMPLTPITRTVRAGWFARNWFAPLHFHYHHEHHLHPGVPFSRLPELHQHLVATGYYATRPELLCDGYGPILGALWTRYRPGPSRLQLARDGATYVARGG